MNGASLSALAALAGSAIGGLSTFATSWLTQNFQDRNQRSAQENARRERIFGEFIDQASKLYVDAMVNSLEDPTKIVGIYAIVGKLRLFAAPATVAEAESVMRVIIDTYYNPPVDLHERHHAGRDEYDVLRKFTEVCRSELRG
jgi:hypothetical protein